MSAPAAAATPKVKKAAKPKKPAAHPKYSEMIAKAITALKERGGSSRQAILKYILTNFNVGKDAAAVNSRLKIALRRGVDSGALKHAKGGKGASGSFKVGEKAVKPKKAKKPKAAKPKKAKAAKKPAGEKAAKPKKAKSPKKTKAAKPKKAKSPKKAKAAKPKKPKTPKKAGAKAKKAKSPKKSAKKAAKK